MSAALKCLPLALLDEHPDNPRLVFRQDVIDAIAANLNGRQAFADLERVCHVAQ